MLFFKNGQVEATQGRRGFQVAAAAFIDGNL